MRMNSSHDMGTDRTSNWGLKMSRYDDLRAMREARFEARTRRALGEPCNETHCNETHCNETHCNETRDCPSRKTQRRTTMHR